MYENLLKTNLTKQDLRGLQKGATLIIDCVALAKLADDTLVSVRLPIHLCVRVQ